MIPTTTGAAVAVSSVLPELKGRLDGISVRVPTPNVSLVDLTAVYEKNVTAEEIVGALEEAASGELKGILAVSHDPLVSIDFQGNPNSSIVDAPFTKVVAGNAAKILSWYDNEWGFSCRVRDLIKLMNEKR
jgi:glyceraldehyde 3-phosphate dehydrogenase